jgi:hypothetical protein
MSTSATGLVSLPELNPAGYRPHPVHATERTYAETTATSTS